MTTYDLTGATPELFITANRNNICWLTMERVWMPTHGKWMIDCMPAMLCGSVMFLNREMLVSGEVARFSLN